MQVSDTLPLNKRLRHQHHIIPSDLLQASLVGVHSTSPDSWPHARTASMVAEMILRSAIRILHASRSLLLSLGDCGSHGVHRVIH